MLNIIPNNKTVKVEPKATKNIMSLEKEKKKLILIRTHERTSIITVLLMSFSFLAFAIAITGFVKISLILSNTTPNKLLG
jgi:hypothetical protein